MKTSPCRKFSCIILSALLGLSVFACGKKAPSGGAKEGLPDTIIIGGLAPLTGEVSIYGISTTNGAQLAFEEVNAAGGINGKQVKYVVKDEKGDISEALNAYNQLKKEGIVALLGDVTSAPTVAVAQKAAQKGDGMPMLTATGTVADITLTGENVFRMCFLDADQGRMMGTYAAGTLGHKKAAVLKNNESDYSVGLADAFKTAFTEAGGEIVAEETYIEDDVDFKTQLTKIKASAPEVLYVPDYFGKDILIVGQARTVGLNVPLLGGDGWDGILGVTKEKTEADGVIFTNHFTTEDDNKDVQSFVKAYKDKYGEDPISFSALGYDAAKLLCQAIGEANSTDSKAIVEAMKAIQFSGVTGENITFDKNGDPLKPVMMVDIENGAYGIKDRVAIEARP